jgi:hypothetical protein
MKINWPIRFILGITVIYLIVLVSDSQLGYMPHFKTKPIVKISPTPTTSSESCSTWENAAGDVQTNCEPVDQENPGWEGR